MAPALSDRISSVLAEIDAADRAVSVPIDRQISLSQRANVLETSILAGQKAVAAAISYNDHRLATIDSPSLLGSGERSAAARRRTQVGADGHRRRDALPRRIQRGDAGLPDRQVRRSRCCVLPLLIWLSIRSRKVVSDDPEMQASARVLRRPISSWLVLLMVSVVVFEPDAPILMHQVAMFIALVPVLRLLPQTVYAVLGPWPYVATGLYLLHRLSFLLLANPYYYRVLPGRTGAAVGRAAGVGAVDAPATRRCRVDHALAEVGAPCRLGSDRRTARRRRGEPDRQRLARRDADRRPSSRAATSDSCCTPA